MIATPTPSELADERDALIGSDALLSDLVRQRGEAKICYNNEDGWFLQFRCIRSLDDSWMTLDRNAERHASPTAAIRGAVLAHNDAVQLQIAKNPWCAWRIIPDNA